MAVNKLGRLRISTAIGYLSAARYRPNLEIIAGATVRRVTFDARRRVTGVELLAEGGPARRIEADIVVLCAGAVHTPGVLVRSGIGAADELDRLGVPAVRVASGVGAGLQDHPALAVVCRARYPELCAADLPLVQTITRYTAEGSTSPLDVNIELITRARWGGNRSGRDASGAAFLVAPSLEQVEHRGRIRQRSVDPLAPVHIEPDFGVNERDVSRHVAAWQDALALTRTAALAPFIEEVLFPDAKRVSSRDDLLHLARRVSASGYHPSCTAHMGPTSDPDAVVDQYGRCYGVEGLVIADASIMPSVPRANTNLTSIMIGEMVGEWLRQDADRYRP